MGSELAEEGFIGSVLPAIILTCEPQLCALFESDRQSLGPAVTTDVRAVSIHMPECHWCENLWEELCGAKSSLTLHGALVFYREVTEELWLCEAYVQIQSVQCTRYKRLKQNPESSTWESNCFSAKFG